MNPNQYEYNHVGKMMIIKAYSKKQIAKHFNVSQSYASKWSSKCRYQEDRKIYLDLTKDPIESNFKGYSKIIRNRE